MADKQPATILLVDDEEMILSALKSIFSIETNYNLLTFTSPTQALADLDGKSIRIDLVVSDYLMEEMDGITFLTKIKERFPNVPRLLLTGYADKENAIKAINDVGLYHYIEKPWSNDDLLLIIKNGVEKSFLMRQLEEKIRDVEKAHKELNNVHKDILRVFA